MSYPILLPLGTLLPKFIKYTSFSISENIKATTNEYCLIASIEDCKLTQEYSSHISQAIGLTLGVGTAMIFIENISNSSPIQKSIEMAISSMLLGSIGIISSYIDYADCN